MGDLPLCRSDILPAFTTCGCDLWGPGEIKDDVIKRGKVTKSVYGVLFTCTSTRAVYLDIAWGASTDELMHIIRRTLARCGEIKMIICNPGTNLVRASNLFAEWRKGWEQENLMQFGAKKGLEFQFIMANSPYQNGISKIIIKFSKLVLKSLMKSIGTEVLTLNELNTLLAETTQFINDRPLGIKPNERVDRATCN